MPLASHQDVRPRRRRLGLVLLLVALAVLVALTWNHHPLADGIETSVRGYMQEAGVEMVEESAQDR